MGVRDLCAVGVTSVSEDRNRGRRIEFEKVDARQMCQR